jgi:hypothetical protein
MIDITKCIGCRKGIWPLIKKDDQILHLDLFSSAESGATYECLNSNEIEEFLDPIEGRGTLKPNSELLKVYTFQELWWEDILSLCHTVFSNPKDIADFFNSKQDSKSLIYLSNIAIENKLLAEAKVKQVEITQDEYSNLLLWNNC